MIDEKKLELQRIIKRDDVNLQQKMDAVYSLNKASKNVSPEEHQNCVKWMFKKCEVYLEAACNYLINEVNDPEWVEAEAVKHKRAFSLHADSLQRRAAEIKKDFLDKKHKIPPQKRKFLWKQYIPG